MNLLKRIARSLGYETRLIGRDIMAFNFFGMGSAGVCGGYGRGASRVGAMQSGETKVRDCLYLTVGE
jgi:hypothetical protein